MNKHEFKEQCEYLTLELLSDIGCDERDLEIASLAYNVGYHVAISESPKDKKEMLKELKKKSHLKIVK